MLRPERMSKVSVTGSRGVLGAVIDAIHDLGLVHLSEYDGHIEGFDQGSPLSGAEEASDKLVTIRALKTTLGVTAEHAGPTRILERDRLEDRLEDVRITVNERDDRRSTIESDLKGVEDAIDHARPFVDLGIDLDLLRGYDTLEVAVGEARTANVEAALEESEAVRTYETFTGDSVVAAFVSPEEEGALEEALVGVEFDRLEVPEAAGDPEQYVAELRHERQKLESKLESVESEMRDLRVEYAGFLLAAEETLSIEVQKREAPLNFATTEHAFVAEGWIPAPTFEEFERTVVEAADGRVDVDQIEVAAYSEYAPHHDTTHGGEPGADDGTDPAAESESPEATAAPDGGSEATAASDGGGTDGESDTEPAVADGGAEFEADDSPPVVLDNPSYAQPFEVLVKAINRPTYWEIDPTLILLLTFPLMFGFMIGDIGYGLLYVAVGYALVSRFESDGIRSLGGIAVWSGVFTIAFGVLYGEFFGLHFVGEVLWGGHPPMHKGLQPSYLAYAQAWLFLTLFVALVHLTIGYLTGFVNMLGHGLRDATLEKGSWVFLMGGAWMWIFSTHAAGSKPGLLFSVFNRPGATIPSGATLEAEQVAYAIGFGGLPESVGIAGLALAGIGLTMLLLGEGGIGLLESLNVLVNVLSYTRIAAVLLAKAGMAFVVNLLFFGAYQTPDGAFHFFGLGAISLEHGTMMFPGLIHMGAVGWVGGILVLVFGHLLVLGLGITSAGLQAVRLEYVEFFGKFYEGGGKKYNPFGYTRHYTTED